MSSCLQSNTSNAVRYTLLQWLDCHYKIIYNLVLFEIEQNIHTLGIL